MAGFTPPYKKMKIESIQLKKDNHEFDFENKDVYVIDVFRATSVIVTALAHNNISILATHSIEKAIELKSKNKNHILCGERNSIIIEGFEKGNSPSEYIYGIDNDIIFTTTNGTRAIMSCVKAENIFILSLLNIDSAVENIIKNKRDVILLMSGIKNNISFEDAYCAGAVANKLAQSKVEIELDDLSIILKTTHDTLKENIKLEIKKTNAFKKLNDRGFERDIDFCLKEGIFDILPKCHLFEDYALITHSNP